MKKLFNGHSWKECKDMVINAYELNNQFSHKYTNQILGFAKWLQEKGMPLTDRQYVYLESILIELTEMHDELMSGVVSDEF